MKANRKINSPRTINNYLTVLFLLGVVATVGFSLLSILQLKEIRSIEERRVAQVADEEIESLLQDMSTSILILANSYSNWDETKQQLSNSNFYSYWRTNRVKEVSFSVPHLRDVE
ncbi:MAG: hypothetical protein OEX00_11765, partial [Gammaproteobacteria bacterium]|nr:hypothetical protein [Gammaproteobacteria bacterium]